MCFSFRGVLKQIVALVMQMSGFLEGGAVEKLNPSLHCFVTGQVHQEDVDVLLHHRLGETCADTTLLRDVNHAHACCK